MNIRPLHPNEYATSAELVQSLVASQFPDWAHLGVTDFDGAGTDHRLYRLGAELLVRMPRTAAAALQTAKEHRWLPVLATRLPLRVPEPVALGQPTREFPSEWSVVRWLEGASVSTMSTDADAAALASFVVALRSVTALEAPPPGEHNAFRGVPLHARDAQTRAAIQALGSAFDTRALLMAWAAAVESTPWRHAPQWIHGDLLPSNLLMHQGRLAAVLDFGLLGAGDPATDLMAAWTTMNSTMRSTFLAQASPDDDAAIRGRGWALSFAVTALPYYGPRGHPLASVATNTLNEILAEGPR